MFSTCVGGQIPRPMASPPTVVSCLGCAQRAPVCRTAGPHSGRNRRSAGLYPALGNKGRREERETQRVYGETVKATARSHACSVGGEREGGERGRGIKKIEKMG